MHEKGGVHKLLSYNPSHSGELIGIHQKASPDQANRAVEEAFHYFPIWAAVPADQRAAKLFKAAELLKERKSEFNAWMVFESGKNWNEAEADTAEAIDFCNYYADGRCGCHRGRSSYINRSGHRRYRLHWTGARSQVA